MSSQSTLPLPSIDTLPTSPREPVVKTRQIPVFTSYSADNETTLDYEARFVEHSQDRAVAQELEFFDKWLDVKVKDELTVQLYNGANEHTIDLNRIEQLIRSLIENERNTRQQRARKINTHDIPQAYQTYAPVGRNDHYSQYDLDMLHFQSDVDSAVEHILEELLPANSEIALEMAASVVEQLLPQAIEAVRALRLEQAQEGIVVTPVNTELSYEDIVEELTQDARALAQ